MRGNAAPWTDGLRVPIAALVVLVAVVNGSVGSNSRCAADDDGTVDYDPAKDFCKLAKEQFKKDLALGITPDPEDVQNFIQEKIDVH